MRGGAHIREVAPTDVCFWLEGKHGRMIRDPSSVRVGAGENDTCFL